MRDGDEPADDGVHWAASGQGAGNAQRNAHEDYYPHGDSGEMKGRREPFPEQFRHRSPVDEGFSEVALEHSPKEEAILAIERLVQPQIFAELLSLRGGSR